MNNILITGGCGYIGSFVCNLFLKKNFKVFVIDNNINGKNFLKNKNIKYYKYDFINKKKISKIILKYKIKDCIHLAAFIDSLESVKKPKKYFLNNYINTKKFLNLLSETGIKRFYFASTAAIYGTQNSKKINENSKKKPVSPYGLSKLKAENYLIKKAKKLKINYVVLRLFNVAGALAKYDLGPHNSSYNHILNKLIRKKEFKIFGTDYPTKDGTAVRDYVHAEDVANAFIKSFYYLKKKNKNQIFNCGSSLASSVREVVEIFLKFSNKEIKISETGRRLGDPIYILADNKKIKKYLKINFSKSKLEKIVKSLVSWKSKHN